VLELVATAAVISALVFFASRHFRSRGGAFVFDSSGWYEDYLEPGDLPCPWCRGSTRETDRACASCGRTFGSLLPAGPTQAARTNDRSM
jgi:hypothetical protein